MRGSVVGALVAVQVMFAVHYVAAKALLERVPAPAWAALRVLAGAAVFLAAYALRGARPVRARDHLDLAALAVLGIVVNQICFTEGLARTSASHSALINTTIPVATLLFAILLRKERPRAGGIAGILVAMAGVLTLLRVDDLRWEAEWVTGDLLTQANALSFSLFLVLSKDTVRRVGATAATAGLLCWGAVGLSLYGGDALMRVDPARIDAYTLSLAAYIVIFPTAGAYLLNSWALARVDSSRVAFFIYLQPVLAATLAVLFLGEEITGRLVASSLLVFAGVFFSAFDRARAPR